MKLASFVHSGKQRIGAAVGETSLLDLQSHWPADRRVPLSMIEFIELGEEGLQLAAKTMALTAADIFENPGLAEQARAELIEQRGDGFNYVPLLGERAPALDYRLK